MRKNPIFTLLSVVGLLCLSLWARGQTVINGDGEVCQKTYHTYNATPAPIPGYLYTWSVDMNGTVVYSTSSSANVYWALPGTGTVKLLIQDTAGHHVDSGSLTVTIVASPTPYITTNSRVACQDLTYNPDQPNNPPTFIDTGCQKTCAYSCVVYHAIGNSGSTFTWTASGAISVTPIDPDGDSAIVCWGAPVSATVTVTELTSLGCTGTRNLCINLIDAPIAHIIAMPDTMMRTLHICDSTEVVFLDGSSASAGSPIVTWRWDFGDGTYSNATGGYLTPVTHQYTTIGGMPTDYWAKLTVTNACGCSTTDSIMIHVDPNVRLKIECPKVVCQNTVETYSVSTTCPSGTWSVIGGTILISTPTTVQVQWNSPGPDGFGYVMFDASSCGLPCAFSVAKVPIVETTGTIQGPTVLCPNSQYLYRLPQWPTTKFNWTVSGGTGATLTPSDQPNEIVLNTLNPGTVTISCSYTNTMNGCTGSANITAVVYNAEGIVGPDKACYKSTITYNALNGSNGSWVLTKPSSATQTSPFADHIDAYFDEVGTYKLEFSGAFCGPEPLYIKVDSLPHPVDTITGPKNFCQGVETKFIADNDISGTLYNWGMLNGTVNAGTGKESFIKMDIASSGPFVIYSWRTTKEMPYCASDTVTDTVAPLVVSMAVSGPDSVCPSSFHNYAASYTDGESYQWSFSDPLKASIASGDGTPNVTALFNKTTGTVWLRCTVKKCFNTYSDSILIHIGQYPSPAFTVLPTPVCDTNKITVQINTAGTSAFWNFGDGTPSFTAGTTTSHIYDLHNTSNQAETVKVIVTNPWGCIGKDSVSGVITVEPTPRYHIVPGGSYGVIDFCKTFSQVLTATYTSGPTATAYNWYYNGSVVGTGSTYTASSFGVYQLEVIGANGCSYFTDTLTIQDKCPCNLSIAASVAITSATASACQEYTFASTHSSTGYISNSYEWMEMVGNRSFPFSGSEYSAAHTFSYGNHNVRYCAQYDDMVGDTCKVCYDTTVFIPFEADISYSFLCTYTGTGGSRGTVINGGIGTTGTNYDFWIDVPITSPPTQSGTSQSYTGFLTIGSHSVIIRESLSGYPAACTTSTTIMVPDLPDAAFTFDRPISCAQEASVTFHNLSTPVTSPLMTADWDFDDGSGNNQYNPYRVFANARLGNYNVTLRMTDQYGCHDSITYNVPIVADDQKGTTALSANHVCEGTTVQLDYAPAGGTGQPVPPYYDWYNSTTLITHTGYHPINIFESGYYWVHTEDQYGCVENTKGDTLVVVQVPDALITGDHDACVDVDYTLNGYAGADPGLTYSWTVDGSGTAITTPTYTDKYSSAGTHTYVLTISVNGCSKTSATFTVTVHALPSPPTPSFNIVNCATYEVQLSATAGGPGTFNWSNGLSGSPVTTFAGGKYQVTFTDPSGCTSKATMFVPKDPKVYLWIFPTGCWEVCPFNSYTITGPIWTFANWKYLKNGTAIFSGSGIPSDYTTLNVDAPGVFNFYLDNGYCNATSDNMYVTSGCGGKIGTTSIGNTTFENGPLALQLSPNPANNSTRIDYTWTGDGKDRCIEVYDVTGRLLIHHDTPGQKGVWQLSLNDFTPGMYQVVMKQDGKVLLNSKLSIVKQ
ncbi:MAG: hypothetical protein BGO70_03030 [Bacteroidetes bacterium 43-93]|uniref:PKD domain-containing protein n=1 Tax=uncultured Dysgonomonas sp. TaxID=206096 RepID=UPI0009290727|nr:PKD domain-containing protein [uncultured Dysgonomonas sp.]MBN9485236.1 T9SS type A sorting domain-containing protein [Bacteroidota bacterium]OJW95753.1 MAG: hypothetical protein BGO70_03030 [Bacteroidetes bacterium 43-93]